MAATDFSERLPTEIVLSMFKGLDARDLCALAHVSRRLRVMASDNHVWAVIALQRWNGKQGMNDIYNDPHDLWYAKRGTWKHVYGIVEQEARRTQLGLDDLVETTWSFRFNRHPYAHFGTPRFHPGGAYTHSGMFSAALPWTITEGGCVRVDRYPELVPFRLDPDSPDSDWGFRMRNSHVTFMSRQHTAFRRRIERFDRELAAELGIPLKIRVRDPVTNPPSPPPEMPQDDLDLLRAIVGTDGDDDDDDDDDDLRRVVLHHFPNGNGDDDQDYASASEEDEDEREDNSMTAGSLETERSDDSDEQRAQFFVFFSFRR